MKRNEERKRWRKKEIPYASFHPHILVMVAFSWFKSMPYTTIHLLDECAYAPFLYPPDPLSIPFVRFVSVTKIHSKETKKNEARAEHFPFLPSIWLQNAFFSTKHLFFSLQKWPTLRHICACALLYIFNLFLSLRYHRSPNHTSHSYAYTPLVKYSSHHF